MTNAIRSPFYFPRFTEQSIWTWTAPARALSITSVAYYVPGTPWESFYQEDERWQFAPHRNPQPYLAPIHLVANSQIVSPGRSTVSFILHLTALFGSGATQVKAPSALGSNTNVLTRPVLWIPRPAELQFWQPRPLPQPLTLVPASVTVSLSALSATVAKTQSPLLASINFSSQITAIAESQASVLYGLHFSGKSSATSQSNLQPTVKGTLSATSSISARGRGGMALISSLVAMLGAGVSQVKAPSSLTVKFALTAASKATSYMKAAVPQGTVGIVAKLTTEATAHAASAGGTLISATSKVQGITNGTVKSVANMASVLAAKLRASGQTNRSAALKAASDIIITAHDSLSGVIHLTAKAVANTAGRGTIAQIGQIFLSATAHIQSALNVNAPKMKTLLSAKSSIAASLIGKQFASALLSAKSTIQATSQLTPFEKIVNLFAAGRVKVSSAGSFTFSTIAMFARAAFLSKSQIGRTVVPKTIDDPIAVKGVGGGSRPVTGSP